MDSKPRFGHEVGWAAAVQGHQVNVFGSGPILGAMPDILCLGAASRFPVLRIISTARPKPPASCMATIMPDEALPFCSTWITPKVPTR